MPESGPEHPGLPEWRELEVLLQGSSRPRPLPAALRARLEAALLARPAVEAVEDGAVDAGPPGAGQGPTPLLARAAAEGDLAAGPGARLPGAGAGGATGGTSVSAEASGFRADLPARARSKLEGRLLARRRRRKWEGLAVLGGAAAAVAILVAALAPGPQSRLATGGHAKPAAAPAVHTPRFGPAGHSSKAPVAKAPFAKAPFGRAPFAKGAAGAPVAAGLPQAKTGAVFGTSGASRPAGSPAAASGPAASRAAASRAAVSGAGAPGPAATGPAVFALSPTKGTTAGGNWVTVRGNALGKVLAVYFGDTKALRLVRVSGGELRALVPPHAAGTVAVSVVSATGRSKPAAGARYTFVAGRS